MLRIGETIDRYRVEALIGQGGMAAVYRARHVQLDSEHAIKVLFITAPAVRERLKKEGRVQANLRHPNIVSVTDILEIQGSPALVMEYIDGPALDTWLLENRPTTEEAVWLFRGILRGITAAHDRGVIHRDLKPANVLLSPTHEGFVPKVTDFGLVKSLLDQGRTDGRLHTQTGMPLGTPEYMSPEQIRDSSIVDQRADMWALGCILYELVCHKRAFSGPDKMSTFNLIVSGTYDPPRKYVDDLPRNVSEAIRNLLEIQPEKRLAHCQELYDLLYEDVDAPRLGRLPSGRQVTPLLVDKTMPPIEPDPRRSPSPGATIPTGAPAAKRAFAPTGLREELRRGPTAPPMSQPMLREHAAELTVESTPDIRPMGLAIPVLLATIVGLGIVSVAVLAFMGPGTTDPPGLELDAPTLSGTVPPEPVAPDPVPLDPVGPEPATSDVPRPRPDRPEVPRPRPVVPTVEPAPAAPAPVEPAGGTGVVRAQGDAKSVWLTSGGQRFEVGELRPGTYQVLADFGGSEPVGAGRVDVAAGSTVTLNCVAFLLQCRVL